MTTLLIVESPAKCKKIESYLGDKYKCIASCGHLQELKQLNQIDLDGDFEPHFKPIPAKKKYIQALKSAVKKCNDVILATDDDREGEAIAWHICQLCNLPVETTKRMVFHEITKPALERALENVSIVNMKIVRAQHARQILDLLVGFKISPQLWKFVQQKLSAGRCQTPALKLIYENHEKIQKEETNYLYSTQGFFTNLSIPFTLDYEYEEIEPFLNECKDYSFVFSRNTPTIISKAAPKPFITSSLQQKANNQFHMSPKETMSLCQTLYEGGYITYMRTDSTIYSKDFIKSADKYIQTKWGKEYVSPTIQDLSSNKKKTNSQEAHEAIRPTNINLLAIPDETQTKLQKMYKLIWANSVESCMSAAKYHKLVSTISAPEKHYFKNTSEDPIFLGWQIVQNKKDMNNPEFNYLLNLKQGDISYQRIKSEQTLKKKGFHYNEAQLINLLEKREIGRPSTFSSIVEKIKDRDYVKKTNVPGITKECCSYELGGGTIHKSTTDKTFGEEKHKLVIQPIGIKALDFLYEYFDELFDYEYTKQMESTLDNIVSSNVVWNQICKDVLYKINELTGKIDREKPKYEIKILGIYEEKEVILKEGPYGLYVTWNDKNISIKNFTMKTSTLETIIPHLEKGINRRLNNELNIRKSEYGFYIFHKTKKMKKPKFLSLANFKDDPLQCDEIVLLDWIHKTYKI